jgi:Receptor L domain
MKKIIFILTLTSFGILSCTKKDDGLRQLDEFQSFLRSDLVITGKTDLTSFKNLTTLEGSLTLTDITSFGHPVTYSSTPISDISALKNLKRISGNLNINGLLSLKSLEALSNLEQIDGDILISGKLSLTDFTGLEKLSKLRNVLINTSISEISLKGFGKNVSIENLSIYGIELKRIKDLESLGKIQIFNIMSNPYLASIDDMSNINITRQLVISGCPNLTTIGKINAADQFAGIHIIDTNVEELSCLSNINKLGQLLIIKNKSLKTLNTENLTNVVDLAIHTNPYLKTLKGIENCQISNMGLQNNVRLNNIDDLKNMKKCHSLTITDNPNLKSIDVLSNVGEENTFFNHLVISGNIVLNDLCPLSKAVKKLLKTRETNQHMGLSLPNIANNGTNMTFNDMLKACP